MRCQSGMLFRPRYGMDKREDSKMPASCYSVRLEKWCQLFDRLPNSWHAILRGQRSSHSKPSDAKGRHQSALVSCLVGPPAPATNKGVAVNSGSETEKRLRSRRRYQVIKQRMNQMACSLRGKLCAKNLLCDREAMSQIEDKHDEFIRFYTQMNLGRSCEVPDKVSSVADLLPMHFNEGFSDTFVSKSSSFKLSPKHNPVGVRNEVGNCVPHLS